MWPALAILAFLACIGLHLWWRGRYAHLRQGCREEIDQLKTAQTKLADKAEARQQSVFDSMVEGVLLLDGDGRVEIANRHCMQLFGLGEDVRGRTVLEATRSHELSELVASLSVDSPTVNRVIRLPGPEERHLEVNAAVILSPQREREGAVVVFHDITRLKQLERTRGEFVANVSHELRTPLSLIKGYAETLLGGAKDDPSVLEKFLGTINRNAHRLQLLIEDLLTISSLESGRVRMQAKAVSLKPLVDCVVEDFDAGARARELEVVVTVPEVSVKADADRIYQVLGNLLDNAIKYGRKNGHIEIKARPLKDETIEVCVTDDGSGIPSDALDRIFERFYRVDKARSRDQGGTGLGLSIVKHIIQSHGGRVWAESELGKGTSIYFTLVTAKP